jgi:hypothetical protein
VSATADVVDRRRALRGPAAAFFQYQGREALCEGGTRCGKTWALLLKIDYLARAHANARILVCRQTRVSLNQSVLTDWRNEILWMGHPAIRASASLERQDDYNYPNGSLVYFAGMENMRDTASPILSTKWDLIVVIQAEETSMNDWEVLATRLSSFKIGYHQLVADCNPAAPSHWLNTRFAPEKCGQDRQRFSFRHYDNPLFYEGLYPNGSWTKEGAEYMGILESTLTGVRRERFLKSRWVAAEGVILDNYDPRTHNVYGELENNEMYGWMLHLKDQAQPIRIAYFTAGIDFGWHPDPGAMQLWGYDSPKWHPNIRRFRCDEIIRLKWQQEEWAEIVVGWHKTYGVRQFSADPHDPENISAFNLRLGKAGGRGMAGLVVKCPPIGGGHRRSPILEPQIDLLREGLGNPKTKHVRTYYLQRWSLGIDDELRRTGRPATEEQEIESWTYANNPDGSPTMKPDGKCDEHGISADRYDQTLNFARGFGRELKEEDRYTPDTVGAEMIRMKRNKSKKGKLSWE